MSAWTKLLSSSQVALVFFAAALYLTASFCCCSASQLAPSSPSVFNLKTLGAEGDGLTDDTSSLTSAFSAACRYASTNRVVATLFFPAGNTFLIKPVFLKGPCGPGFVFWIDATVTTYEDPNSWGAVPTGATPSSLIYVKQFNTSLVFNGSGTLDGRGQTWWSRYKAGTLGSMKRPNLLYIGRATGIRVDGLTFLNSPLKHLSIFGSSDIAIRGVSITSPDDSPNTDGIFLSQCRGARLTRSFLSTGDDNIAIYDGTENVTIEQVTCNDGHGISIGSLAGTQAAPSCVRNITVRHTTMVSTDNGLRIKSGKGSYGAALNIFYKNVTFDLVKDGLVIDQAYSGSGTTNIAVKNVVFNNIKGTTSSSEAIVFKCDPFVPCTRITINDVNIKPPSSPASLVQNIFGFAPANFENPTDVTINTGSPTATQLTLIKDMLGLCGF